MTEERLADIKTLLGQTCHGLKEVRMTYQRKRVRWNRVTWEPAPAATPNVFEVLCACGRKVRFREDVAARCHCGRLYIAEWTIRLDDRFLRPEEEARILDERMPQERLPEKGEAY